MTNSWARKLQKCVLKCSNRLQIAQSLKQYFSTWVPWYSEVPPIIYLAENSAILTVKVPLTDNEFFREAPRFANGWKTLHLRYKETCYTKVTDLSCQNLSLLRHLSKTSKSHVIFAIKNDWWIWNTKTIPLKDNLFVAFVDSRLITSNQDNWNKR